MPYRSHRAATRALATALPLLGVTACALGGAGAGAAPAAPTANSATGESCATVADFSAPLIVDWRAHERANLEEIMTRSVAVVAYDCRSLRVLPGCHIEGGYGAIALSRKEEVVELDDADEIRANLPTLGAKLAIDASGELERGASLDLAMIVVGKRRTTLVAANRDQLVGDCDGATHFVRGAFLGAFAMGTATRGKVHAAADLFGATTGGQSVHTRSAATRDGDRDACNQLAPGATTFPPGCSALLRLELVALGAREDADEAATGCPRGMALIHGKCTQRTPGATHPCTIDDAPACAAQCERGVARSCYTWGLMFSGGRGVLRDDVRAADLFAHACEGGELWACTMFGIFLGSGRGIDKDEVRARQVFHDVCDAGDPTACTNLARMLAIGAGGAKDKPASITLLRRACDGGAPEGCARLAAAYESPGSGVAVDGKQAAVFYRRACDGGNVNACARLAWLYEHGQGVAQDRSTATSLYRRACSGKNLWSCDHLRELANAH